MLILLLNQCGDSPYQTPSLHAPYLAAFTQHRYFEFDTDILIDANTVLRTLNGTPITTEGAVKNVKWVGTFYAVTAALHSNRHQQGPYRPSCTACFDKYSALVDKSQYTPHSGVCFPNSFQNTGCPTNSLVIKKLKETCKTLHLERKYRSRKRDILLPRDVLDIHDYVKNRGYQIRDIMYYLILILSIDCAMRYDGIQDKSFNDWEEYSHLWRIQTGGIEHLAHTVCEKNDAEHFIYKQQFREVPRMCSLRFLLIYVHCSAHRTGPMFPHDVRPHAGELDLEPEDLIPAEPDERRNGVSYQRVRRWIVSRLRYNCRHTENFKFGCHSPRVTFYFFAAYSSLVWGLNLAFEVIKRNARHKDQQTSESYQRDSGAHAEAISSNPTLLAQNPIYKFHDGLLQDSGATAM